MRKIPLLSVALLLIAPAPGVAQGGGEGFLFKTPVVTIGIKTGIQIPRASSDIFDHSIRELTLERDDFRGAYLGFELAGRVSSRLDIAIGVGHASSSTRSEFRDWVDLDDNPIEQVTELSTTPITVGAKYYLSDRGREIGRFAWIPTRFNAFVGGGLGITIFDFEQRGDWVDFESLDIFNTRFASTGNASTAYVSAGADLSLNKNLVLTGEGRYSWAKGTLDEFVFEDFDKMDLAGLRFTVGVSARF